MNWISVKDKLPEEFERVLGYAIENENYPYLSANYFECKFDGNEWHEQVDLCRLDVTHWMPLPKPPTEMTNDKMES